MINRSVRSLDREKKGFDREEKKLTQEIKKMAKANQMVGAATSPYHSLMFLLLQPAFPFPIAPMFCKYRLCLLVLSVSSPSFGPWTRITIFSSLITSSLCTGHSLAIHGTLLWFCPLQCIHDKTLCLSLFSSPLFILCRWSLFSKHGRNRSKSWPRTSFVCANTETNLMPSQPDSAPSASWWRAWAPAMRWPSPCKRAPRYVCDCNHYWVCVPNFIAEEKEGWMQECRCVCTAGSEGFPREIASHSNVYDVC